MDWNLRTGMEWDVEMIEEEMKMWRKPHIDHDLYAEEKGSVNGPLIDSNLYAEEKGGMKVARIYPDI